MNGILLIDKEADWTSNDVVSKMRGILHERRIGHSGTLDPMATGLLVCFVGRATRAVEFAESHDKRYNAALRLGLKTDTQDIWGNVIEHRDVIIGEEQLRAVLRDFTGEQQQIPPMYSAIKHKGKRLYEIARSGGEVERQPRGITVHSIELLPNEDGDYRLDIRCSKGTYIRTLCNDIGERLGCGGCMSSLRRVQAGMFSLEGAVTLSALQSYADEGRIDELLIPVDRVFAGTKEYTASSEQEKRLRCGNSVKAELPDGEYRVYSNSGEFLLLGRVLGGELKTVKSFFEV